MRRNGENLDDGRFAVTYKNGDDGDGEDDAAARDANGHQGQQGIPAHVLHFQVETSSFVVVRPTSRTAVGALELVLDVFPRVAPIAAPTARIALNIRDESETSQIITSAKKPSQANRPPLMRYNTKNKREIDPLRRIHS